LVDCFNVIRTNGLTAHAIPRHVIGPAERVVVDVLAWRTPIK
jgi:hypothetical protein